MACWPKDGPLENFSTKPGGSCHLEGLSAEFLSVLMCLTRKLSRHAMIYAAARWQSVLSPKALDLPSKALKPGYQTKEAFDAPEWPYCEHIS